MDKLLIGLSLLSVVGNIWLAISWKKAQSKALLTETYARIASSLANRNKVQLEVVERKERHIRELEKNLVAHLGTSELVDELNGLFSGTEGGREASTVPIAKRVPKGSGN